jgi:hypothetical protein
VSTKRRSQLGIAGALAVLHHLCERQRQDDEGDRGVRIVNVHAVTAGRNISEQRCNCSSVSVCGVGGSLRP